MWAQEKVQILVAIHASLPAISEKAALLWAAGVPNSDAAIITGAATSSSERPRTPTRGITPQGPRTLTGVPAPPPCRSPQTFCTPESAGQLPHGL